jgi:hypothetical protein
MSHPTLESRILQALGDPGSIAGRKLGPTWGRGNDGYAKTEERLIDWQLRAVLAVLNGPGGPTDEGASA